jgi:hypothetical protein
VEDEDDGPVRLPDELFFLSLDLGPRRAAAVPLPPMLPTPEISARPADGGVAVDVEFGRDVVHWVSAPTGVTHHFHHFTDGPATNVSPWTVEVTDQVLAWGALFVEDVAEQLPSLAESVEEALDWQRSGLGFYAGGAGDEAQFIRVELLGTLGNVGWLGSGHAAIGHGYGEGHEMELLWSPEHVTPSTVIARARASLEYEDEILIETEAGIDWTRVGVDAQEVLDWFGYEYDNHMTGHENARRLFSAALARLGGVTADEG